jgi:glycosyltransferase involved in cell wall biosynthesis
MLDSPLRISVVLCTCNGQPHLPRQLRSLADQERPPDELLIFDDCSTDATPDIARHFASTAPFPVRFQVNPVRLGATQNFQSAIAAAAGDIIAPCDQDDVWYPEKLARISETFAATGADLVFSDADLVDAALRPLGRRLWQSIGFTPAEQRRAAGAKLWPLLLRFNAVTGAAMAFKSTWRDLLLPIPDGWSHDGWIGLLLSMLGNCRWIDEPLWCYRRHPTQQIGPGHATFSAQIAGARRMDREYFQSLANNFTGAIDRIGPRDIDLPAARALRDKILHCRLRAAMRAPGANWPLLISRELFSGRYWTCGLGWRSLMQDVWLRSSHGSPS